jgi:hypothetical protein
VTLDERIRHASKSQDWTVGIEGGSVIRALHYARNSVHHDWSAALDIGLAQDELLAPHAMVFGITWIDALAVERPDQRGAAAYADTLAGRNVGETLLAAGKVYEEGIKAMRAANARPREVNTEAKAMALYHCVYPEENFEKAAREIFDLSGQTCRKNFTSTLRRTRCLRAWRSFGSMNPLREPLQNQRRRRTREAPSRISASCSLRQRR